MWTRAPSLGRSLGPIPSTFGGVSDFGVQGDCESCGAPNELLHRVQREYFSSEPGGESTLMPDVENWCFACCTHYPHRMLD